MKKLHRPHLCNSSTFLGRRKKKAVSISCLSNQAKPSDTSIHKFDVNQKVYSNYCHSRKLFKVNLQNPNQKGVLKHTLCPAQAVPLKNKKNSVLINSAFQGPSVLNKCANLMSSF